MRVVRVIQLLVVLALIGYLLVLHSVNPQTIILPFLISLPTSWVVAASLLLGFVVGWLSLAGRVFKLGRENRALRQRLIKAGNVLQPPVIPDRTGARTEQVETTSPRSVRLGGGSSRAATLETGQTDTVQVVRSPRVRGGRSSDEGR